MIIYIYVYTENNNFKIILGRQFCRVHRLAVKRDSIVKGE